MSAGEPTPLTPSELEAFRARAVEALLAERKAGGVWVGELSSSALSTATAVTALLLAESGSPPDGEAAARRRELAERGVRWLVETVNEDGGYGDTTDSPSNISTTTLAWVALGLARERGLSGEVEEARPAGWLEAELGTLEPARLAKAIQAAYGSDRTFSVPILAMCALGGRLGEGRAAWRGIPSIPFELAALPHGLFQFLGLPMVSYALPALIGIGQVIEHHRPTWNLLTRLARAATRRRTLAILREIQPTTGGYLEATPLTSFVTMSLIGCGHGNHPVVTEGLRFLEDSARPDGSWPIDTDLSSWVSSLSIHALSAGGRLTEHLDGVARQEVRSELLARQYLEVHPYTRAAPGGWAWTGLSGGVPDADDTPAALLALGALDARGGVPIERASKGARWLADLQNRDGGMPTFCRGWGKLPFDRSSPDLTAHALRAWWAWEPSLEDPRLRREVRAATRRAVEFLGRTQRDDGAWVPLWFGNQHAPDLENPLYGTSRVLLASDPMAADGPRGERALERAIGFVLSCQADGGGFGGAPDLTPSIEETALAVEALATAAGEDSEVHQAIDRALAWLARATDHGRRWPPSPIGLYFAKLWYHERLYPLVFTVAALERCAGPTTGAESV